MKYSMKLTRTWSLENETRFMAD